MLTSINQNNRKEIIDIISSIFVCLQILITEQHIEELMTKYSPNKKNHYSIKHIIDDIYQIIVSDEFENARTNIAKTLKDSCLFKTRAELAKDLQPSSQLMFSDLIQAIHACNFEFMQQLHTLIEQQDDTTRHYCRELIKTLSQPSIKNYHTMSESANLEYGCEYTNRTYGGCDKEPNNRGCCNIFLQDFNSFKVSFNNAISYIEHAFQNIHVPAPIAHGFEAAGNFLWSFKSKIQNMASKVSAHFGSLRNAPEHHVEQLPQATTNLLSIS
jgi:hypothetical protein